MYIVLNKFKDLEDDNHIYNKDDIYPFKNKEISADRLEELSSDKNNAKMPLIANVELKDLNEDQLVSYAKIKGIDLKKIILESINPISEDSDDSTAKDKTKGNSKK